MAAKRLFLLSCALIPAVLAAGCIPGGDADTASSGGRTRSSRRGVLSFGKGKKTKAAEEELARASAAALDGYTPESSMQRDMDTLKEQESRQAQLVARLAGTRGADPAKLAEEQEKLFALRDKIQSYDTALQRFEMAARVRPEREPGVPPALVPEEMFQERAVQPASFGQSYMASREQDRLGGYDRPANPNVTHARVSMNEGYAGEGEQVLYSAAGNQNLAAVYGNTGSLPGAGMSAPRAAQAQAPVADPVPTRFAGAPVGHANFQRPVRKNAAPDKPWEGGGHLFAKLPETAPAAEKQSVVPNIYANRAPREEETLWPAGMAMVPPASPAGSLRPAAPKTEVRLPAAPAQPAAAPVPAAKPAASPAPAVPAPAAASLDDEVFSPSMFLGGGL